MAIIYKEGSRGTVVKQIQKALKQVGFGVIDDGIWGPITTEAVKAYQRQNGLDPDGVVGAKTLARMGIKAVAAAVTPSSAPYAIQHGGIVLRESRRRIDYIVVHCTASREGQAMTVEQIRRDHKAKGWSDIGYHYVVAIDGSVFAGRDVDLAGAHVTGHNTNSIGVVYVGGLENRPDVPYDRLKAKDTRTDRQKSAMLLLLMNLHRLYPGAKIVGHRDFSPDKNGNGTIEPSEWIKQCPSFDAKSEYRNI